MRNIVFGFLTFFASLTHSEVVVKLGWQRVSLEGTVVQIDIPSTFIPDNSFGQFRDQQTGIFLLGVDIPRLQEGKLLSKQEWRSQMITEFRNNVNYLNFVVVDSSSDGDESFVATMKHVTPVDTFYKAMYYRFHGDSVSLIMLAAPRNAGHSLSLAYKEIFKSVQILNSVTQPAAPFSIQLPPAYKFVSRFGPIYFYKTADVNVDKAKGSIHVYNDQVEIVDASFQEYVKAKIKRMDKRFSNISEKQFIVQKAGDRPVIHVEFTAIVTNTGKPITALYSHLLIQNQVWSIESYDNEILKPAEFFKLSETFQVKNEDANVDTELWTESPKYASRIIMLDAEDLAEFGIKDVAMDIISKNKKLLRQNIVIDEIRGEDGASYHVKFNKKKYTIFAPGVNVEDGQSWEVATDVFFKIINSSRRTPAYRFYAIYGGNELMGIFLTNKEYLEIVNNSDEDDIPYIPGK